MMPITRILNGINLVEDPQVWFHHMSPCNASFLVGPFSTFLFGVPPQYDTMRIAIRRVQLFLLTHAIPTAIRGTV